MNVRRASPSPSSSVDSTTFRRRSSSIGKKKQGKSQIVKSKEDVQVFTSLPPKVEGDIKYYLKLQITKINLTQPFLQILKPIDVNNQNSKNIKSSSNKNNNINNEQILARCVWWGEESNGSLFRPKILNYNNLNKNYAQTTAKYVVRSGYKQFSAYLNDMKTLDILLIKESTMEIVGKVQIYEIGELSDSNQIKGFFPAFNSSQTKIADVYVSVKLDSTLNDSIDIKNDQNRPVTPTSLANINEFYTKYQKFEQKQQQLQFQKESEQTYNNKQLNSFKSDSYITNQLNNHNNDNKNDIDFMKNHPIIDNLIDRANKLKNEMTKSTYNLSNNNNDPNVSICYNNDESYISFVNYNKNSDVDLDSFSKHTSFIDHPTTTNFLFNKINIDRLHDSNLNDISRLSDPIHDPELLSALLYTNNASNLVDENHLSDEIDMELNELLNPKHLNVNNNFNNLDEEPIKLDKNNDKINFSRDFPFQNRNRSLSRSSVSSNDDNNNDLVIKKSNNSNRVSFEIQSSDGESSSNSIFNELKYIDVISKERIALLNLVQIAKLKIEKMCLFNLTNVTNIMERINNLEQFFNKSSSSFNKRSQSTTNLDPSFSKPPKAIKKQDTSQLFFIEYQFPVLANSRDNNSKLLNGSTNLATQVMRAYSKTFRKQDENLINSEDVVTYEHNADYSILFNPELLDSWWKSTIIFKIYLRSPSNLLNSSSNLTSLNNQTKTNMPYLIGVARLNLRNLLKSRNFKLYKKLAITDQLTDLEYNTYSNNNMTNYPNIRNNKRIGTLHVKLELLSDLKEFNTTLIKLNKKSTNNNNSLKLINGSKKTSSASSILNNNNNNYNSKNTINKSIKNNLSLSKLEQPFEQTSKFNNQQNDISYNQNRIIDENEFSIPIQIYLSINDGKGFKINGASNLNNTSIYLICRLFWTREKIKFESTSSLFSWTLNLSFILKKSLINNMKNNYMILEAWQKNKLNLNNINNDTNTMNDSLIGTIKLPLHEFYLRFNDETFLRTFLSNSQSQPLIGVDGWINVCDPFSGQKAGEINVLLAMGSNQQILNLTKYLIEKSSLSQIPNLNNQSKYIEHIFKFKIENIKIHPVKTILNDTNTFDESNCFINYTFPTTVINENNNNLDSINDIKFLFNTYSIASKTNTNYYNKLEHRLILKKTVSLYDELINKFISYFYGTSNDKQSSITSSDCFIYFQVWSKSHYPNQREKLIANGQLLIDKLISVVNNSSINLNNRTFIIPLTNPNENNDKFIGQLHLTVEYRTELINYNLSSNNIAQLEFNNNNIEETVCLNIGLLRASGLQAAISHAICRNNLRLATNIEQSKVFIKFSLSFLNRPNDIRYSKQISTTQNAYSPEFFDYFDVFCPLITSNYDPINNRKISLAEQIQVGKLIFEIWNRVGDERNDILLGICIVPLESLLDKNRTSGIRGWLPIKSTNFMGTIFSDQILNDSENNKQIGGLELSIRFKNKDDIDKIIESRKDIDCQLFKQVIPNHKPNTFNYLNDENNSTKNQDRFFNENTKGTVKCLIEIEKAVHLPNMYDEKTKKYFPPNPFVSFSICIDDPSQVAQTNVIESQSSPVWNYQLLLHIDNDYFLNDRKYFIMKVYHANDPNDIETSGQFNSKILGTASIDLSPLICGLTHISGWYNIQDSVDNCHGQIKINILPQENLFALKEMYLNKKNRIGLKKSDPSKLNNNSNNYLNQPNFDSAISLAHDLNTYDTGYKTQQTYSSSTLSSNFNSRTFISNSTSFHKEILNDNKDLKTGLFLKLNELDEMNKILKERLEKKSPNIKTRLSFINNNFKNTQIQIEKEINKNENNLVNLNATESEIIKIVNNVAEKNDSFESKVIIDEAKYYSVNSEQNNNQPAVFDSFWLNNSDGFELQMQVKEKLNQIQEFVKKHDEEFKNDLPPFQKHISNENINFTGNLTNLNDTEYDETFNLNASYEIVPNKNSEHIKIPSDDESVDKIIDCSKLEENDDFILNIQETEDLVNFVNEQRDNDQEIIIENENQFLNDQDVQDSEDNFTVIVPEELNKIDEMVDEANRLELDNQREQSSTKASNVIITTEHIPINTNIEVDKPNRFEINLSEKIKEINSKIPNYFLPKEDLEKTMRKLHYNYTEISKKEKLLSNEDLNNDKINDDQSKLKSTDILNKNKSLLKQDFNRINKIFHTKFN